MNKPDYTMAYDIFEREFADDIGWRVETLLGEGEFEEFEYDAAYEVAVNEVATEKGIELV
jgi:hypothetical protein